MNTLKLVFAFIGRKPLTWAFHALTLALGVAVVLAVLLTSRALDERVNRDLAGVDLVVGAAGSPLQLILSSLFHIDAPTGNITLETAQRLERNGMVALSAPVSLGDSIRGVRIVGTDARIKQFYNATVADGRWFDQPMQVVLGAQAARTLGKTLGATFIGTHGFDPGGEAHGDHPYTVVGVLAPTGSALDRVALTATESVWVVHAHHDAPKTTSAVDAALGARPKQETKHEHDHDHAHDHADDADHSHADDKPKEITALLVRYKSPMGALALPRFVRTIPNTQAAVPAIEAGRLNEMLGAGANVLGAFGYGLLALSALGFFVALFAAVQARQRDLVLLRTLGAGPALMFAVVALEALLLGLLGGAVGIAIGRFAAEFGVQQIAGGGGPMLTVAPLGAAEGWALLAAACVALFAAIIPAIMAARAQAGAALKAS